MGQLVGGVWKKEQAERPAPGDDGRFQRVDSVMRNWVTADGRPGPDGGGDFKAEPGRYHLYIAINCPWAHRTLIMRHLKGLEDVVSLSVVLPRRTEEGWVFDNESAKHRDACLGTSALREVYTMADPRYSGRVTVPVLWDKARRTIVNNESAEIIRMFNSAFAAFTDDEHDYYPSSLRAEIEAVNARIYKTLNNGVYRTGFARTQDAYEEAVVEVFATLDWLEARLDGRRYLIGDMLTEADWRLFPTSVRFDAAYHGAFKCNLRRIVDYPNLWGYTRELYQMPGIAETIDLDAYKQGYYSPSPMRNPLGMVPMGPLVDFSTPHGRA